MESVGNTILENGPNDFRRNLTVDVGLYLWEKLISHTGKTQFDRYNFSKCNKNLKKSNLNLARGLDSLNLQQS